MLKYVKTRPKQSPLNWPFNKCIKTFKTISMIYLWSDSRADFFLICAIFVWCMHILTCGHHGMSRIKYCTPDAYWCLAISWLSNYDIWFLGWSSLPISRPKLCHKCALLREGPSYPRSNIPMGMSLLALAHFVMECTIEVKARQNIILLVSYNAMLPYGSYGG